MKAYFISVCQ